MFGVKKGKTMNGFECYKTYIAIKSHFNNDNYDYFRYNGEVSATKMSYESRKDRYFFDKLASKYSSSNVEQFFVANFVEDNGMWIGESFTDQALTNFNQWKRRVSALNYTFKQDLSKMPKGEDFENLFTIEPNKHPKLLILFLQKEICIETMVVLDVVFNYSLRWTKHLKDDIVWEDVRKRVNKYRKFIEYKVHVPTFKKVMREHVFG